MKSVFEMELWQTAVVAVVAIVCLGIMIVTIARLFSRESEVSGGAREATAFESALVSGEQPEGAEAFDGFSYRVGARFAGKVRVMLDGDTVSVAGPRVPRGIYVFWIWLQGLLLALVPVAFVLAAVKLDWRALVMAIALLLLSFGISSLGAGLWPGLGEMPYLTTGRHQAVEFPLAAVSEVKVGPGWSDGGLGIVLLPYRGPIDNLATDHAVSWFAPDGEGREVRYAIHFVEESDASEFAALLKTAR